MALFYSRLGDILTVRQETYSFFKTEVMFVRYNLVTWMRQVNNDPWQPASEAAIIRVKCRYLPALVLEEEQPK